MFCVLILKKGGKKVLDKKGLGDKLWSIINILFLVIIGISVVAMVYIIVGSGYDSRESDAIILGYKITKCLEENDLVEIFVDKGIFNVCGLNEKVIEKHYIIRICGGGTIEECFGNEEASVNYGGNFQLCGLEAAKGNSNFVQCDIREVQKMGQKLFVLTGAKQDSRRVGT
jgi:hypothetical protein